MQWIVTGNIPVRVNSKDAKVQSIDKIRLSVPVTTGIRLILVYQIFARFFFISLRIFLSFNLRSLLARVGLVLMRFLGI